MTTTDDDVRAFPARLRTLREHLGHDVPTFAELVNLSPRTIRKHEAGEGMPKIRTGTLLAISDGTGASIDWLMTGRIGCEAPRDDSKPRFRGVYRDLEGDAPAA